MSAVEAGQRGRCELCGEEIEVGDLIVLYEDDWVHVGCEDEIA